MRKKDFSLCSNELQNDPGSVPVNGPLQAVQTHGLHHDPGPVGGRLAADLTDEEGPHDVLTPAADAPRDDDQHDVAVPVAVPQDDGQQQRRHPPVAVNLTGGKGEDVIKNLRKRKKKFYK